MLAGAQFVVEWNQHAAAKKDRIGGDQPLRLVRHDDRGAVVRVELRVFERARQRQRDFLEIGIGQPQLFAVALGFDQADFGRIAVERIAQGCAQTGVLAEIKH